MGDIQDHRQQETADKETPEGGGTKTWQGQREQEPSISSIKNENPQRIGKFMPTTSYGGK